MKQFSQFYQELKESEEVSFTTKSGKTVKSIKHYNNHEMTHFLKKPENKEHEFIGKDKYGRPHTAIMNK